MTYYLVVHTGPGWDVRLGYRVIALDVLLYLCVRDGRGPGELVSTPDLECQEISCRFLLPDHFLLGFSACYPPRWPSGKASASRDPGFESRLRRVFFGVESYQ